MSRGSATQRTAMWIALAAVGPWVLALAAGTESAPSLLDVVVDADAMGGPRVSLIADGPAAHESFVLDGPPRLVLDLEGVVNRVEQYRQAVDRGGVLAVRAAQHTLEPQPVTRVVIDLARELEYRVSAAGGEIVVQFGPSAEPAAAVDDGVGRAIADSMSALEPVAEAVPSGFAPMSAASPASSSDAAPTPAPADPLAAAEAPLDAEAPAQAAAAVEDVEPVEDVPPAVAQADAEAEAQPETAAADPAPPAPEPAAGEPELIDRLLEPPTFAAPEPGAADADAGSYATKTIVTDEVIYTGKRISLNLVDADVKQVFRLFHEISGLNFVLDPGVTGAVTIVLDQVPWDQALDIILKNNGLDKVLDNNVLRIATTKKLAEEAASRRQLRDAQELEVEPVTLTRTLSYAKARDVERVIQNGGILSPRGHVIVDERTNTLIISDVPKKVEPVDSLISTLDAETPQVMIEARIVESSRSYVRDLGVVWGFEALADASRGTSTGLSFPHNASASYALNLPGAGGASQLAFSLANVVDSFTLDVALNTLETEGHGRILSSPKVATQNNERAEIEQGVRFPIVNTTATEINVEFVSASLRLAVTPQITAEGTIILDVEVENNSPDFVNTSGDVPSIRTQRAQTKVLIGDGGTTVIGGIFVVNEGTSEVGVPWFRKIPVFGWLFKTQNITKENRELLIFITPKIVRLG